ncbi:unnamed protein product [Protopolystoma xenopodis]|uniref:Uncharacterized protein n=1 Tax=Protopolystoma xenopodis TaxID=117903 RepID=A0A448WVZ0_9PLAT|nr:unnamed protein product [Protopolystoma xenopodis]
MENPVKSVATLEFGICFYLSWVAAGLGLVCAILPNMVRPTFRFASKVEHDQMPLHMLYHPQEMNHSGAQLSRLGRRRNSSLESTFPREHQYSHQLNYDNPVFQLGQTHPSNELDALHNFARGHPPYQHT